MFCDAERGSVRMKRRKEREERGDEAEKITTKSKTNPTPILEEILRRLGSQNCGRTRIAGEGFPLKAGENRASVRKIP